MGKPPLKVAAQIGQETLYKKDFHYLVSIYFPKASQSRQPVSEETKNQVLKQMVDDSLLLQAAASEGLIKLDKKVYNSPDKNYKKRNFLVSSIEGKVEKSLVNLVKGELISIWFKNIYEPEMGLTKARQVASAKIEAIHHDLALGKLTSLKEAAEVIKKDTSLAAIDPSYQGNAYIAFEIRQGEQFFIDPKIQAGAFELPVGQFSSILVGQDQNPGGDFYDCNFIVMKIEERKMKGYQSFEEWFAQKRKNYEVEIKI